MRDYRDIRVVEVLSTLVILLVGIGQDPRAPDPIEIPENPELYYIGEYLDMHIYM